MFGRRVMAAAVLLAGLIAAAPAQSPPRSTAAPSASIEAVLVHPPLRVRYTCSEHYEGEYGGVFDALGQDCVVLREGRTHIRDGSRNEDYHAWGLPVLAPFDGTVEKITISGVLNRPGTLGKPPATSVIFRRADGVRVGYAHVDEISVTEGDSVTAGQPFAVVSNNGMSSSPHIHVGAWKEDEPMQIRWDLRALGAMRRGPARERSDAQRAPPPHHWASVTPAVSTRSEAG